MNHLGGKWNEWWLTVEWFTGSIAMALLVYLTCEWPPRNKENGLFLSEVASSAATWQYGICLD